ncbi:MAG TPA: hypothetical protein VGR14_23850 [Verrucomicrobiae bacterium]|jgi:hypothetical protein|nr:hypothetical protein [Verrucomicrobiae bacterium]
MSTVDKSKVIDFLEELSDEQFQRSVWLASSGPEISSLTEAICGLFDDSGLSIALDKGKMVFTEEIDDLLRGLGHALGAVEESLPPARLIIDPKMVSVREQATRLLHLIKSQ